MPENGKSVVHIIFKHYLRIHGRKFLSDKHDQTSHVQTYSPGSERHLRAQQKHQDQRKGVMTHFPRISMKQKGQQLGLTAAAINVKGPEKSSVSQDGTLLVFFPLLMTHIFVFWCLEIWESLDTNQMFQSSWESEDVLDLMLLIPTIAW